MQCIRSLGGLVHQAGEEIEDLSFYFLPIDTLTLFGYSKLSLVERGLFPPESLGISPTDPVIPLNFPLQLLNI